MSREYLVLIGNVRFGDYDSTLITFFEEEWSVFVTSTAKDNAMNLLKDRY